MTWTYSQSSGQLTDPDGELVATGYAGGNRGANPEGKNNPDAQDQPCIGPLPQGVYTFSRTEDSPKLGPFAILLDPDPGNEMYGRSVFRMHGDSIAHPGCASEGCIIMPRAVREKVFASADHTLIVVKGV